MNKRQMRKAFLEIELNDDYFNEVTQDVDLTKLVATLQGVAAHIYGQHKNGLIKGDQKEYKDQNWTLTIQKIRFREFT